MSRVPDPLPDRAADTTAERPWPLRLLAHNIGVYVDRMPALWVEAQVVSLARRSGLAFLDVRDTDTDTRMSAVVPLRTLDAAGPGVREGARVVLRVQVRFHTGRGTLSLFVVVVRPVGEGELLARLEQLRRTLAGEGLFDPARKRPLPFLPRAVGLVCGRGSAAERDVVDNARRRWPAVRVVVREVAVQGPLAVTEVGEALAALDADAGVDVIVVARGGGSTEDLLPFSNEALVRAVAACRTPVVSAIGHETDTPLLDLVADVRASTPTDAARRVVPDATEEARLLAEARGRGHQAVRRRVEREREALTDLRSRPALRDLRTLFADRRRAVVELRERGHGAARRTARRHAETLTATLAHLRAVSPGATLARGYAVVRGADGHVLTDARRAAAGDTVHVALAGGALEARVTTVDPTPRSNP
ncbi:exodeoxyribonuclease VII large subunit [Aquipuribacter nitratireducens]|uniref:Exodeoxyribonuclease 7 large subunit n=1 Tax=Aquipuribacter nitratireducens TaxID=650104 RepID=A0ABW0GN37_9MICO